MFEKTPFHSAQSQGSDAAAVQGRALHAVGWNDLAARINAARDLRELLKRDLVFGGASFTDAAAGYFVPQENGKPPVNHNALGACKGFEGNADCEQNEPGADPLGGTQE